MPNLQLLPFHDWLVELRRDLHRIPELGYKEEKTTAKICQILDELRIPYQTSVGKTGVVDTVVIIMAAMHVEAGFGHGIRDPRTEIHCPEVQTAIYGNWPCKTSSRSHRYPAAPCR